VLLEFLSSGLGAVTVVGATVAVLATLVVWARQQGHPERVLILAVGLANTALVALIYGIAVAGRWWVGAYFETPAVVQGAILVGVSMIGWTVWLSGYRSLSEHTRQALQIYVAVSVLLVLTVALAHRLNLGRGAILVGPDLTVVLDAVIGLVLLWIPVIIYEALRRTLERAEFLP
jgi:hypothetical protein